MVTLCIFFAVGTQFSGCHYMSTVIRCLSVITPIGCDIKNAFGTLCTLYSTSF